MSDMPPNQGMFSLLDLFVVGGLAGFAVYWFLVRKKNVPEATEIKRLAPSM